MKCPKCGNMETKVVDSRMVDDGMAIRRRRECEFCGYRFTTFEKRELTEISVIKKDGTKEIYDRQKLKKSILLAFAKRNYNLEDIDNMINTLESKWSQKSTVESKQIGMDVLSAIKDIDIVAYVRFASVYNSFDTMEDFKGIIEG